MKTILDDIEDKVVEHYSNQYPEQLIRDLISFQWEKTAKTLPKPNITSFEVTGLCTFHVKQRMLEPEIKKMEDIHKTYLFHKENSTEVPYNLEARIQSSKEALAFLYSKRKPNEEN